MNDSSLREFVPLLSYLSLVFVFFHSPNLKRSFNLFWRQVLGLGLEGQVLVNNTAVLSANFNEFWNL